MKIAMLALLSITAPLFVNSATITWGGVQNITADATVDVKTDGTYVAALGLGQTGSAVTVNGVLFNNSGYLYNSPVIIPNYEYVGLKSGDAVGTTSITVNVTGADAGTGYSANASYNGLLNQRGYIYQNGTYTSPIFLNNLTVGSSYQVQIWSADSVNNNAKLSDGLSSVTLNASIGQYVIGTFMASSASQELSFMSGGGATYSTINAISLRQVPEPGVAVLLSLFSIAGVVLLCRRSALCR